MGGSEKNIPKIAQMWMNAWNTKNAVAMSSLFTPDGVYEDLAFELVFRGKPAIEAWVQISTDHIPDLHGEIIDAFQTENRVSIHWNFSGTPELLGQIKGTGRSFKLPVTTIFELQDGKTSRITDNYNLANLLRQMGLPFGPYTPSQSAK